MKHTWLDRRALLTAAAALGLAAAMASASGPAEPNVPAKPNIVLIVADDLGYECLGANGGTSYRTPVLDRLAATGMRFEHCYAQPLCTPSRVQIMTGIYNVRNYTTFGVLDRSQTTFAHLLKQNGYATCVAGKWQLGSDADAPRHFGFDESCLWQHTRTSTDEQGCDTRYADPQLEINGRPAPRARGGFGPEVASDFICNFIERNRGTPFFVYYPMILTHRPFVPTPDSRDWRSQRGRSASGKGDARYFGDMVAYMDKTVGKITAKLDDLGLRGKTLVLFTSDNGTDTAVVSTMDGRKIKGGKGSMADAGTRVPLIANWPGVIPAGQRCDDLVDFSDFLPTICAAAGTTVPAALDVDGRSFWPQLTGQTGRPRTWIYCWYSSSGQKHRANAFARNQRYKLYRTGHFYDVRHDVLEETDLRDSDLDDEATRVRALLQNVLDRFADR